MTTILISYSGHTRQELVTSLDCAKILYSQGLIPLEELLDRSSAIEHAYNKLN